MTELTYRDKTTYDYIGLSTDTKPTTGNAGDTFYELDTKSVYIYSPDNLNSTTSSYWWEIS